MKNLLVCLGFLCGCGGEKDQASDEASANDEYSGEQLIEMYHTANCNLFSDISCFSATQPPRILVIFPMFLLHHPQGF